jgi:UDP-GlcNAc:undecaprenyl-phosphate GlcNAc-1-phosphate transferase
MGITNKEYFLLFALTYLLVGGLTPVMRSIAIATNVVDLPNSSHKSHKLPVPYLGGVAIIIGVLSVSYSASFFSNFTSSTFWLATSVLGPALVLGVIGLWDDIKNLRPLPRFIVQSFAGIFTAVLLVATETVGNPTGSKLFDSIFTILWVVGICNAVNFFDNLDGGAAGTVAISSIAIAFLALTGGQYLVGALATVTAGATLGFLVWNKSPAKIYMGDAGALFLGFIIAVLTIRLRPGSDSHLMSFFIPIFMMAIPILDTSVAVSSRIQRNLSPFQGGQDHLSHRLIRSGFSRKTTALILWGLTTIFCVIGIALSFLNASIGHVVLLASCLFWALLYYNFLKFKDI